MKDFNYCIWYNLTSPIRINKKIDFPLHITIIKEITKRDEAQKIFHNLGINKKLIIPVEHLSTCIEKTKDDNFFALTIPIKIKYDGLPKNSHMSICYKYNNDFTEAEEKFYQIFLNNIILNNKNLTFSKVSLNLCKGSYKNWKKLEEKILNPVYR